MDWKDIGSLGELAGALSEEHIVQTAIRIEQGRSLESEQTLLRFHGLNAPGLITTPFMYQVGICARDAGCVSFNGLERTFLPPKKSWIHPTLTERDYDCRLERDRLVSAKTWPFMQDGPMGDFNVNTAPKWWSHGLVHALTGFAYWPGMSEWDVMLMARVGEMAASLHWYWLAELGRQYCPIHSVASGDTTPDCEACRRLEAEAALQDTRLERLGSEDSRMIALNAIQVVRYEASAYEQGRTRGVMLQPKAKYLEMGEAADYAHFHHRRLTSSEFGSYIEACLRPGEDYARSHEEFEARVVQLFQDILSPRDGAPELVHSNRARRVLMDLGLRLSHGTCLDAGLGILAASIESLRPDMGEEESDAVVKDAMCRIAGLDLQPGFFDLGYRPTSDTSAEPDMSKKARLNAYHRRIDASGSPIRHFMHRAEQVSIGVIDGARTSGLVEEVFHEATRDQNTEDMGELMRQAFLGWLPVAAESWGPDNANLHIGQQWMYRIAYQGFPEESLWAEVRLRPNPYLDSVPLPFDVKWLDEAITYPDQPLKPKHALRVHYVLVGQGRRQPLFLPFTQSRKRLLNALQETPSIAELVEQGFEVSTLRAAFEEELVIGVQHGDAFTLYVDTIQQTAGSTPSQVSEDELEAREEMQNPWDESEQARYYEDYCTRSSLYKELATATIEFAGLAREGDDGPVADLGCGSGVSTQALLERVSGKVLAIDPSHLMLTASARNIRNPRVDFHLGKAEHLPLFLEEVKLSGLLCNSAFWLDGNLPKAMNAISRALSEGGRFGMSIPAEFLGHYEHRIGPEPESFFSAVNAAREAFGIEFDESKALPSSPLLGDATRFLNALEANGFIDAEYTVWTYNWTAHEYLDWLRQPTVSQAMAPNLKSDQVSAYMDSIAEAVDPELPLESHWCLIRARVE